MESEGKGDGHQSQSQ